MASAWCSHGSLAARCCAQFGCRSSVPQRRQRRALARVTFCSAIYSASTSLRQLRPHGKDPKGRHMRQREAPTCRTAASAAALPFHTLLRRSGSGATHFGRLSSLQRLGSMCSLRSGALTSRARPPLVAVLLLACCCFTRGGFAARGGCLAKRRARFSAAVSAYPVPQVLRDQTDAHNT